MSGGLCDAGRKRLATEVIAAPDAEANIVRRIVNAWDCCGTCAGGVLANHVRAAVETEREQQVDRLTNAAANLASMARGSERLTGKHQGVLLALSYIEEDQRIARADGGAA